MSVLDPDLLLRAYAIGVFPMSDSRDARDVYWVEPRRRAVIPLDRFHLSRSLRKTLRSGRFEVTLDRAFPEVVRHCADREDTWINEPIERSYNLLHSSGHAHSIEVWETEAGRGRDLVGGLYGVRLGAAFFGESMFSKRTDASKVALAWLVARLIVGGFQLLDCQFMTEHLRRLGAVEIPQSDYLTLLASALGGTSAGDSAAASPFAEGSAGAGSATGSGAAEFGALDRLLAGRSAGSAPEGWVIAQLLGQTS
ncbi:leucyl/phenylalanyl-tRNA--protein transferase [Sphingosinicella sp. CPCC 101087]|uniref:leucyl/phenylalanyl-tRNA--protein transferase n=1 Tax=Sphingosinicella sp. CPCC 101087 TaxID=2497754 RepID=UPI00101B7FF7|nr:leucyl/phenylalanyl-tRNA--protein transferase [Sphingosinicella sp. CPCC 101087]